MKLPKNMTEPEVLEAIETVVKRLASKFRFGFHDIEDMKQEGRRIALEAIDSYDGKRPLPNFLWSVVHNGLFNFKRDNYHRPDQPCLKCPLNAYDPNKLKSHSKCTLYEDKMDCELYKVWFIKTNNKINIINTLDFHNIDDEKENNMKVNDDPLSNICNKEINTLIDKKLPVTYRQLYLKYKAGSKLSKSDQAKIKEIILDILREEGYLDGA